jgi:hypothetical protein
MLDEGLPVPELHNEELEHFLMKMPVERYRHTEECQALVYTYITVDIHLENPERYSPAPTPHL